MPARFALRRMRAHAQRTVVVAVGIAVGAAVLALTAVGSGAVQDRAVQRGLAQLQPSDRAIQAVWSGVPAQSNLSLPQLDHLARAALRPVLHQAPFGVAVFRQATWGGAFVNLGAVDGLSRWLVLRSGRLPRTCTPDDCELVQIGGAPRRAEAAVPPRRRPRDVPRRRAARARTSARRREPAADPARRRRAAASRACRCPDAALIARTYGWIVPVAPGSIHDWELASLGTRLDRAQARLERASDIFGAVGADRHARGVRATSRVAGERLLILGGDAAVLLLGFAVLASSRLRRDHRAVRRRLTWIGARPWQILLVAATEVAGDHARLEPRRLGGRDAEPARCSRGTSARPAAARRRALGADRARVRDRGRARGADGARHARRAARRDARLRRARAHRPPTSRPSARSAPSCSRSRAGRRTPARSRRAAAPA